MLSEMQFKMEKNTVHKIINQTETLWKKLNYFYLNLSHFKLSMGEILFA